MASAWLIIMGMDYPDAINFARMVREKISLPMTFGMAEESPATELALAEIVAPSSVLPFEHPAGHEGEESPEGDDTEELGVEDDDEVGEFEYPDDDDEDDEDYEPLDLIEPWKGADPDNNPDD